MKLKGIWLTFLYFVATVVYQLLLFIPFVLLTFVSKNLQHLMAVGWGRTAIILPGIPRSIVGTENIPDGPMVIACNHTSMLDIQLMLGYFPRKFHFVIKEELFKIPIFGTILTLLGYYPLNRTSPQEAYRTARDIIDRMKNNGESILIFPEGTRNPEGILQPFKRGFVKIAAEGQFPILPVALKGCHQVISKTQKLIRQHPVAIVIGQPIQPPQDPANREELNKISQATQDAISALLAK